MKLTNRNAGFQKVKKIDSEGGRKPSERSIYNSSHVPYIYGNPVLATGNL